jgi:1-deoxy-D-xylulose-5-phosphate synthase
LLGFGAPLKSALAIAESLDATVADMRFVKPLDDDLVASLAESHDLLVTLEENATAGGAGSAVLESLAAAGVLVPVLLTGLPDRYIEHASPERQWLDAGLDSNSILTQIQQRLARV